jgi:hypothetical protein
VGKHDRRRTRFTPFDKNPAKDTGSRMQHDTTTPSIPAVTQLDTSLPEVLDCQAR